MPRLPSLPTLPRISLPSRRPTPLRSGRSNLEARRARRESDVDALLGMLEGDDAGLRAEAAAALGRLGPPSAALDALLRRAEEDPRPSVRREAVGALGALGQPDEEVRAVLRGALGDMHTPAAMYAAQALGRLRDQGSIGPLAEASRARDPALRLYAVEALAAMRRRAAYDALVIAAEDRDRRVAIAAIGGLAQVATPADDEVLAGVQERIGWARRWRAERLRRQIGERGGRAAGERRADGR